MEQNNWYTKILALLKLETTSTSGRINLAGVFIVAIFSLAYTASDTINFLISSTADVVKTITLKEDVYHAYESVGVVKAVLPTVIALVLCLLFLMWNEKKKIIYFIKAPFGALL